MLSYFVGVLTFFDAMAPNPLVISVRGHPLMMSHTFEDFLTPSPLCNANMTVILRPSYIVSKNWKNPPPTCVTSFMDNPLNWVCWSKSPIPWKLNLASEMICPHFPEQTIYTFLSTIIIINSKTICDMFSIRNFLC